MLIAILSYWHTLDISRRLEKVNMELDGFEPWLLYQDVP
jgi:hypothetical protein